MMRDILFRGKSERSGEWVYGSLIVTHGGCVIYSKYHPFVTAPPEKKGGYLDQYVVDPRTVGQYTGLTDKNGKKMFEGDIIIIPPRVSRGKTYGIVEFGDYKNHPNGVDNTNLGFYIRWVSDNEIIEEMLRQDIVFWISYFHADVEVIGNIHDNPELLEA